MSCARAVGREKDRDIAVRPELRRGSNPICIFSYVCSCSRRRLTTVLYIHTFVHTHINTDIEASHPVSSHPPSAVVMLFLLLW